MNLILNILSGLNFLAGLLVTTVFIYTVFIYSPAFPDNDKELKKMIQSVHDESKVTFVPFQGVTLNIPTEDLEELHHLSVEYQVVPLKKRYETLINENKALIMDQLFDLASQMAPEQLGSITGKLLLEERMKKAIHKKLGLVVIKQIYFTRFVIQ